MDFSGGPRSVDCRGPESHGVSRGSPRAAPRRASGTRQRKRHLSSRKEDLVETDDGSVDVYFGATAPEGKESNWIQTVPGKSWFASFRFSAPTEPFFDKSWALPDFEKFD
jgi:hypothetical protein